MDALPLKLIDQYARPKTIKNTIKNAIDCFHIEASSAMVSMKLDSDLRTTLLADEICRISGTRAPRKGLEDAKASTACVFGYRGQNYTFIVSLGPQANYPRLQATGHAKIIESILWLDDRSYEYSSLEIVFVQSIECVWN